MPTTTYINLTAPRPRHNAVMLGYERHTDTVTIVRCTGLHESSGDDVVVPIEGSGHEYIAELIRKLVFLMEEKS